MNADDSLKCLLSECMREHSGNYATQAVLNEFPTVRDLMNASEEEMQLVKGIGPVKAKQLSAIVRFAKYAYGNHEAKVTIGSPQDAYKFMRSKLEHLQVEEFHVIGLNTKNSVVFENTVSIGSLNSSIVTPRETFQMLIRRHCAGAIVAHNHPSGDPKPSNEDISLTEALSESGKILGIPILDHVIIGRGKYYSFKEQGLI